MSHPTEAQFPGAGHTLCLAVGDGRPFPQRKQVASYLGLIPREHSSGGKRRMGGISARRHL
jgi:transposase